MDCDPHKWGRGDSTRIPGRDIPEDVMDLVRDRDGTGCVECNRRGFQTPETEPLEVDHKQPLSKGGTNHWTNLQLLCRSHNRARCNRPMGSLVHEPAWMRRARL